jgi:uncharacterized DUF497 family protein
LQNWKNDIDSHPNYDRVNVYVLYVHRLECSIIARAQADGVFVELVSYFVGMVHDEFEWDDNKAASNLQKHNVSFEEAATVFDDMLSRIADDVLHSDGEMRSVMIGLSARSRLLFVSFAERNERIRIISAREATKAEKKAYGEQ